MPPTLRSFRHVAAVFLVALSGVSAWVTPGALPMPLSRSAAQISSGRAARPRVGNGVSAIRAGANLFDFGAEKGKSISEFLGIVSCDASHILVKGPDAKEGCEMLMELIAATMDLPVCPRASAAAPRIQSSLNHPPVPKTKAAK